MLYINNIFMFTLANHFHSLPPSKFPIDIQNHTVNWNSSLALTHLIANTKSPTQINIRYG